MQSTLLAVPCQSRLQEVITYVLSGKWEESFIILSSSVERFMLIIDFGLREQRERYCLISDTLFENKQRNNLFVNPIS
jgi:hypothetical protein